MIRRLTNTKFKKDILFSYFTQAIGIIFGFINIYLITNYAGVEKYGQYSILVASVGFMSLLLTARSGEAVVKFYKREKINHNYQNAKTFLFYGFIIDIITATFLFVLVYFLSDFIAITLLKNVELSEEVFLFSFINVLFFLRGTINGYLNANEMFYVFNSFKIVEVVLLSIILFYTFTMIGSEIVNIVKTYIYTYAIIYVLSLSVFLFNYFKEFLGIKAQIKKESFHEYFKFNIITFSSSALKAGNQNFDNLVLSYFTNPTVVGIYTIVKKFFSPIQSLIAPFQMITYPKLTKLWYEKKYHEFDKMIKRIVKLLFTATIMYFILLFLCSDYLISIFKLEYENVKLVMYLMMMFFMFASLLWWTRNFSNIVNPKYSLYAGIYYTIGQVSLFPPVVYFYEIVGLQILYIILYLGLFLYWLSKYKKELFNV